MLNRGGAYNNGPSGCGILGVGIDVASSGQTYTWHRIIATSLYRGGDATNGIYGGLLSFATTFDGSIFSSGIGFPVDSWRC